MIDCLEIYLSAIKEISSRTRQMMIVDEEDAMALVKSNPSAKEMSAFYIRIGQPALCKKDGFPYIAKCRWAHKQWMWTCARAEEKKERDRAFEDRQRRKRSAMNACIRKRLKMAEVL